MVILFVILFLLAIIGFLFFLLVKLMEIGTTLASFVEEEKIDDYRR